MRNLYLFATRNWCCDFRVGNAFSHENFMLGHQMLTYRPSLLPLLVASLLLLGGCLQERQEEVTAALPLNENLPPSWTPLNDVLPVNIDGDDAREYLLYFTYDGSNGPVGAVIYNTETDEEPVSDEPAAGRLSTSFIPYAVLPSYQPGAGQGFIAEPGQQNAIGTFPVAFHESLTTDTEAGVVPDALAILGGTNYLTWVWWQPQRDSYGVTQLHAADRFETPALEPFNWETWRETPEPIRDIVTVHPLYDRNRICRRRRHRMVAPAETLPSGEPLNQILYQAFDLGMSFCRGVPEQPFYPEGVVLAYLSTGEPSLWDQARLAEATLQQQLDLVAQPQIIRVDDLAGYKTIPGTERTSGNGVDQSSKPAETKVCVELIMPADFTGEKLQTVMLDDVLPGAALGADVLQGDSSNQFVRRWLLFTLYHEPPHREPATADRLYIHNVQALPVLPANGAVDCRQRLEWQNQ